MSAITTISVKKATADKLTKICEVLGKDKMSFLEEFFDALAQIVASNQGNVTYEISVLENSFTVYFEGARSFIIGKARTDEEVQEKIDEDRLKRETKKRFG
jgi:hypothetical protein